MNEPSAPPNKRCAIMRVRRAGGMRCWFAAWFVPVCLLFVGLGGCHRPPQRMRLEPIPLSDAVRIANDNVDRIDGVLRASGAVDGWVKLPDGRKQSFHLDGVLFYLAPNFVRFDLKSLGQRQLLFGSNDEHHWYYDKQEDQYFCGRHGEESGLARDLPVPPDQIIDILGLRRIPLDSAIQRVVEEHQQILIVARDQTGRDFIRAEYWLDRYAPRLLRRIVFRDGNGVVFMASDFDEHTRLGSEGPWLPRRISATWPQADASMTFHVSKWRSVEGLGPESIQFALPQDCAKSR